MTTRRIIQIAALRVSARCKRRPPGAALALLTGGHTLEGGH
jgi:hypothetical protein